ncbi:MAG: hypothetical protein K8T90_18375 [Planctomycetes bacterium]|nr:hypothetical protein [Planctomycetota bacterium]
MSATPPPAHPRKLRKFAVLTAAIVGAACLAVALWRTPRQAWDDERARLRAAGYAISQAEWLGPGVPVEENGAPEIDAADAWLTVELGTEWERTTIGPWRLDRDPWWKDATPEDVADTQALLVRAEPYFRRVAAAARRPHLRWEPGSSPFDWTANSAPRLQRLARMCSAAARFSSDPARRLESVATELRIAALPDRPIVGDEAWVRRSCARSALEDLRYCVESGAISAADAARTLQDVPIPQFADRYDDTLRAHIAAWASVEPEWFLSPLTRRMGYLKPYPGHGPVPVPLRHGDIVGVGMLPIPSSLLEWTWYGASDLLRGFRAACEVRGAKPSEIRAALRPLETPHDCNHHFEPIAIAVDTLRASTRIDASAGLTRIALAARRVRETTGRWPVTLADLGGDFPVDPFSDVPFGYEVVDDAIRVTSRGAFAPDAPPHDEALLDDGLLWVVYAN